MIPLKDSTKTATFPKITLLIIVVNLGIYFCEFFLSIVNPQQFNYLITTCGSVPANFLHPLFWPHALITLFTSMFLHGSWGHVIGNMWFLWLFGDNVEDRMGHKNYLFFYLGCGVAAGLMNFLVQPTSMIPTVGASGAIAGIMGAYLLLFKRAYIISYIPPFFLIPIPSVVYLVFWFIYQFVNGAGHLFAYSTSSVAFWAHIGGFLFGLFCHHFFLLPYYKNGENYEDYIDI